MADTDKIINLKLALVDKFVTLTIHSGTWEYKILSHSLNFLLFQENTVLNG